MYDVVTTSAHAGHRPDFLRSIDSHDARRQLSAQRHRPAEDDRIEISEAARDFDDARAGRTRAALVARIRAQIADGTYLTPERINVAVDRLHRAVFGE